MDKIQAGDLITHHEFIGRDDGATINACVIEVRPNGMLKVRDLSSDVLDWYWLYPHRVISIPINRFDLIEKDLLEVQHDT